MKTNLPLLICFLLTACNNPKPQLVEEKTKHVFRFELDSEGNITNEEVKQQLLSLAKEISISADRMTLTAYSEQTGSVKKNEQIASEMAYAAKRLMLLNYERIYYNVGVNIAGYANPVDSANPSSMENRRIEFTPM